MDIRNCPECDKIFAFSMVNLCPVCQKQDEVEFERVKAYLYDNPRTGVHDLAEATEVDDHKIIRWLKSGRIEGKAFSGIAYSCESCGRNIQDGRYCATCSNELARGFNQKPAPKKEEERDHRPKFHTRD